MNVIFSKTARKQLEDWEKSNPKTVDKIDELLDDIRENGFLHGKGKPEQLKYYKPPPRFSRHITRNDRLVYSACNVNDLLVISCKGHYDDK